MERKSLLLLTPAYKRFDISRMIFESRAEGIEQMKDFGIDAQCLVVADDENLDSADAVGFETMEFKNDLGERLNQGLIYAAENGYDFVHYCDTDFVVDPEFYRVLHALGPDTMVSSRWFSVTSEDGRDLLQFRHPKFLMHIIPTSVTAGKTIWQSKQNKMINTILYRDPSILELKRAFYELHPLELVQFQSDLQISKWAAWATVAKRCEGTLGPTPWDEIAAIYGQKLVDSAQRYYEENPGPPVNHAIRTWRLENNRPGHGLKSRKMPMTSRGRMR